MQKWRIRLNFNRLNINFNNRSGIKNFSKFYYVIIIIQLAFCEDFVVQLTKLSKNFIYKN